MPEFSEEQENKFKANVEAFEQFLSDLPDDVTLYDLDNFEIVMHTRLRSIMTVAQMHQRAHMLIQRAEHLLHTPGAFTDEQGLEVTPILVENFEDPDDVRNAMTQLSQGLSEEELEMLLDTQGEEE